MSDNAPPPRKRRRCQKIVSKGKLITKSFILRKNGKGTQTPRKQLTSRKKLRSFKCIKCNKHCKSVRALNQHFKEKHRPLQCSKCSKFFATQGALKLHAYKHMDGQFECKTCKKTSPSRANSSNINRVMKLTNHTNAPKRAAKGGLLMNMTLKST